MVESASAGSSSSSGKRAPASAANGLPEQETQGTGCPGGRRRGPGKHSLPAEERGRSDSGEGIHLIDEINHNSTKIIADYIENHPGSALVGLYMAGVIRKMERFGDHCTNIAEELIFYLDAKVMKHIGKTEN